MSTVTSKLWSSVGGSSYTVLWRITTLRIHPLFGVILKHLAHSGSQPSGALAELLSISVMFYVQAVPAGGVGALSLPLPRPDRLLQLWAGLPRLWRQACPRVVAAAAAPWWPPPPSSSRYVTIEGPLCSSCDVLFSWTRPVSLNTRPMTFI